MLAQYSPCKVTHPISMALCIMCGNNKLTKECHAGVHGQQDFAAEMDARNGNAALTSKCVSYVVVHMACIATATCMLACFTTQQQ